MKKVGIVVAVILGLVLIQPVQASEIKTIAIIDTAMDVSKNSNVVYEACFTLATCPNGTNFQEGPGSANVSNWKIKGIEHGFNVSRSAVLTNPNIKIVFVRISDVHVYPTFSAIHNNGTSLSRAIEWVSNNASRLNINAVSISQTRSNFAAGTCPKDTVIEQSVQSLNSKGIATFAATGNESKKNMIGFPSCVPGVIAVGAVRPSLDLASYTNAGPGLDLVARGDMNIVDYFGVNRTVTGTSIAAPIAATLSTTRKVSGSWDEFITSLPKTKTYPYIG
jgi:hypothetical protein